MFARSISILLVILSLSPVSVLAKPPAPEGGQDPPVTDGPRGWVPGSGSRLWEGNTGIITHAKDEDDGSGGCTEVDNRRGCR